MYNLNRMYNITYILAHNSIFLQTIVDLFNLCRRLHESIKQRSYI